MRNTLICTVGTSLFQSNLARLEVNNSEKPDNWQKLKEVFDNKQWNLVAKELLKIDPTSRVCGAEINTIEDLMKRKPEEIENIFFLVSDTEDGRNTGLVLRDYFKGRRDLSLKTVDFYVIEKLQDQNPQEFKLYGLRNLVRKIGDIVQRVGSDHIHIDATGGYKAQIAIAVIIGQVLNIPVHYKHERFSEIINFPPLPINFDYSILGKYSGMLHFLEKEICTSDELKLTREEDEKIRIFLEEIEDNGTTLYTLSPLGALYLLGYKIQNHRTVKLVAIPDTERREPSFRDDHYPIGFKEYVYRVWRENKWIKTTYSLPYHNQRSIKETGFNIRTDESGDAVIGTYVDKNGFGARFRLVLDADDIKTLTWVVEELNAMYQE